MFLRVGQPPNPPNHWFPQPTWQQDKQFGGSFRACSPSAGLSALAPTGISPGCWESPQETGPLLQGLTIHHFSCRFSLDPVDFTMNDQFLHRSSGA